MFSNSFMYKLEELLHLHENPLISKDRNIEDINNDDKLE
jgi:hypothetical protein